MSLENNIEEQAQIWLLRVMSKDLTEQEQQEFEQWYAKHPSHKLEYERANETWSKLDLLEDDLLADTNVSPLHIPPEQSRSSMKFHQRFWVKHAATFLLCTALLGFFYKDDIIINLTADHITAQGEQTTLSLPDGSLLTLNTDTAIDIDYSKKLRRIILLKGEAFVQVKPNAERPFIVVSDQGSATALGTAFAVKQTKNEMLVTVTEGTVSVKNSSNHKKTEEAILQLNQSVIVQSNGLTQQAFRVNTYETLAWRSGKLIFKDEPLNRVLQELDRYFPGKILVLSSFNKNAKINGVFEKDNIIDAIKAVASTQNKTVSFSPGQYLAILN